MKTEQNRTYKYDVVVLGGGFAGVAAAIASSRNGAKTLLIEQGGALGGAAVHNLVNPFMGFSTYVETHEGRQELRLCRGIFGEIYDALEREDALGKFRMHFKEETLKNILDRLTEDAGVETLFHTTFAEAEREQRRIKSITTVSKAGLMNIAADCFIDCTGDADLAHSAGVTCRMGRDEDGLCQPMTLCFRLANVDTDRAAEHYTESNELYKQFQREGKLQNPREDILMFEHPIKGVMHMNTTRIIKLDPTDPFALTKAEKEGRRQVMEMYQFLKNNCKGFENCELISTAPMVGVRESRRIDGEYLLTAEDLQACVRFEDAIAVGNYDIDIHSPVGGGTSHYYFPEGTFYTIPYRALIPKGLDNLLVAGRCISVTHEAQASIRIMPIVCCIGQAAGTAAEMIVDGKMPSSAVDIGLLRERLQAGGAFLG